MPKLVALSLVLLSLLVLPATALAAEEEGEGPPLPVADLTFSPQPLDFGKATVGTETGWTAITVHNAGALGVPIDKVAIEGVDSAEFKSNGSTCGWLEAGGDCTAWVAFMPGSTGAKTALLVVEPKEMPTVSAPLTGIAVAPQLSFNPGSYDFGIQRVNRGESSANFQLSNTGEAITQLSSLGFGGKDSSNFWTANSDCWNGRQLQPGESCNVQVGFNPWDTVGYEAELQAYVNGATFGASVSGTGGRAQVEPGSIPSPFGAVTVGAAGPVETIVFSNHGNLDGNFFIGIVAGGDSGSFLLLDESCSAAPLAPGATCTAHVRFTPQSAGPKLARLALFGDDDGGTMALLSGEGVDAAVTLAPAAFDFGATAAGERGVARAFAVRNDGSTDLELDSVALSGADPDQFLVAGDECSGATLAPGDECLVRIRFAPDGAGAKTATLRVRGEAGSFSAALSGVGTAATQAAPSARGDRGSAFGSPHGPPPPRPWRQRAHRPRFARGDAVASLRGRALRRADLRARTIPLATGRFGA